MTDDADNRLAEIMTGAARDVLAGGGDPYWVGIAAAGEILDEVIEHATHGGAAYVLWGELTDVQDHPKLDAPAWCAALTRLAAEDWLAIDSTVAESVARYFERWADPILQTPALFTGSVPDSGWRDEHYRFLKALITDTARELADRLVTRDIDEVVAIATSGEYGSALEHLTGALAEDQVGLADRERRRLSYLAKLLPSARAHRDLARLPPPTSAT
ncbi:hypothetical protein [Antribacter gilvus]|uniref:hypothetical protein n=1 Tax=Antribacter gilvus TaxID=2304675 RepID=UPI000F77C52E|nr:hypothetical protein [Antribacter gilvus]